MLWILAPFPSRYLDLPLKLLPFCSADYIDWIPLGLPTRIKYTYYPIKPLNCPWLSYPFIISYSHLVLLLFLDGALDLILFNTLIQLIVAPPYVTLIRWRASKERVREEQDNEKGICLGCMSLTRYCSSGLIPEQVVPRGYLFGIFCKHRHLIERLSSVPFLSL